MVSARLDTAYIAIRSGFICRAHGLQPKQAYKSIMKVRSFSRRLGYLLQESRTPHQENGREARATERRPRRMSQPKRLTPSSPTNTSEPRANVAGSSPPGGGLVWHRIPLGERATRSLTGHGPQARDDAWGVAGEARPRGPPGVKTRPRCANTAALRTVPLSTPYRPRKELFLWKCITWTATVRCRPSRI